MRVGGKGTGRAEGLTLLKKRDSEVSALCACESTVSSSIQLGLTKLLLG